jgi:hypothetical protein
VTTVTGYAPRTAAGAVAGAVAGVALGTARALPQGMHTQLTFGLMSGEIKTDPIAIGDCLVTRFGRVVVTMVDENIHGPVFLCAKTDGSGECVVLPREIEYRSR